MEPNISRDASGPYMLLVLLSLIHGNSIALAENAIDNGVELKLETEVKKKKIRFIKLLLVGEFKTRLVINCAGVFADKIHNMVARPSYSIRPRKGIIMFWIIPLRVSKPYNISNP